MVCWRVSPKERLDNNEVQIVLREKKNTSTLATTSISSGPDTLSYVPNMHDARPQRPGNTDGNHHYGSHRKSIGWQGLHAEWLFTSVHGSSFLVAGK